MTDTYWIKRGENVIGTDVLALQERARQAPTYAYIANWITTHDVKSVLDMGCNVAALGVFLNNFGWKGEYVGLDSNPHALAIADKHGFRTVLGNVRTYNELYPECIVMKDVLEHLEGIEPLRNVFGNAEKYAIVASYIPWLYGPEAITLHPDGYYTNRYNWRDIFALADECHFTLLSEQTVYETNGTPNLVTIWARGVQDE